VAIDHAAVVGVAASDATLGRSEIRYGLTGERRESLGDADATRTGLSAAAVERGWDVGCRREEVEGVDVVGSGRLAVGSGDVEPREGAAQDERVGEVAFVRVVGLDVPDVVREPGAEVVRGAHPLPLGHTAAHVSGVREVEAFGARVEEPRGTVRGVHPLTGAHVTSIGGFWVAEASRRVVLRTALLSHLGRPPAR